MDRLSTYAAAIHRRASPVAIVGSAVAVSGWTDQGVEVTNEATDYRFDNGVVIRRSVEQDSVPSEAVCAECWITYDVLCNGTATANVLPARKTFENACRESFWLAYHTA